MYDGHGRIILKPKIIGREVRVIVRMGRMMGVNGVRVSVVSEVLRWSVLHTHTRVPILFGVGERSMKPIPPNKPFSLMCTVTYLFS